MKVLVVSAAGKTGRLVVERALAASHSVTALVHDSESLKDAPLPAAVTIISGDVHDLDTVKMALAGCEGVIDTLGGKTPWKATDQETTAAQVVIEAMQATGAKRLVVISVLGAGDSREQAPFWYDHILLPTFLHGALPDKNHMEAEVKSSGLEWVLVRPPMLTDGEATHKTMVIHEGETAHKITRADLAQFLVDRLTGEEFVGKAVTVANS